MTLNVNKEIKKTEQKKGLKGLLADYSFFAIIGIGLPIYTITLIIQMYVLSLLINSGKVTEQSLESLGTNAFVMIPMVLIAIIGIIFFIYAYLKLQNYILENYKKVK